MHFHHNESKLVLFFLCAVIAEFVLVWVVVTKYMAGSLDLPGMCIAAAIFVVLLAGIVRPVGLLIDRRPVVELRKEGLLARDIAAQLIPWRDIEAVRVMYVRRQAFVELRLSPDAEKTLPFTGLTRFNRVANRIIGCRGIGISTIFLPISAEDLVKLIREHMASQQVTNPHQ